MDDEEYLRLLDKAISEIPEGAKQVERWNIPRVEIAHEGKRTIIKNWKKIIDEINRDEKHLFKKICKELGTAGDIQKSSGRAIIKSIIKRSSLDRLIENYCKEYVICQTCKKPDTVIVKEGRNHVLVCQACGTRRIVKL
ncbi:MAG: translation initiation factor IF-2 subunit beta [Promethearchaeota archaeon]